MTRNEKYIAYTRALSELILIVDDTLDDYGDGLFDGDWGDRANDGKSRKKSRGEGVEALHYGN